MLKTTDRDNALGNVFVAEPPLIEPYPAKRDDPIFAAIKAHKRALDRRNKAIEEICATEERCKLEERDVWDRYQKASVAISHDRAHDGSRYYRAHELLGAAGMLRTGKIRDDLGRRSVLIQSGSGRCSGAVSRLNRSGAKHDHSSER